MSLKVNGQTYSWGDVDVKIPGLVLVVQEISYDDEQDMEESYGKGNRPRGYGKGNYKASGKMSMLRDDYDDVLAYGKAGIALPRTAQEQYNVTQHIPLSEAKAGDLVFFHSTYNAGTYITHVGLYVGNNRMYHAGNPIGYADLTGSYWQQHLAGAGRIKQ